MNELTINVSKQFQKEFEEALTEFARDIFNRVEQSKSIEKEWMNQAEACEWLGISFNTLQKWRREGLKIATVDGITLVSRREINRFLSEREF